MQNKNDTIYRQAAIGVVEKWFEKIDLNPDICIDGLISLPSAERQGKWKEDKDYPNLTYLCSECGYFTTMRTNFCPGCGADMRWTGIYRPKWDEYIIEIDSGSLKNGSL